MNNDVFNRLIWKIGFRFARLTRTQMTILCSVLIGIASALDYLTGTDTSMTILYLIPIFLGSWFLGAGEGLGFSLLSGIGVCLADLVARRVYLHPVIHIWNYLGIFVIFVLVSSITASLRRYVLAQRDLARVDYLTGISNRRAFFDFAQTEILRARRNLTPLTVAYIDIDKFKAMNDRFGHHNGDQLLKQVALTIKTNLRATDSAARLGGDEYAFLLPNTNEFVAKKVIEKVHYGLTGMARSNEWPVAFSIGAVTFLRPPANVDELLHKSDSLMYSVKKNGEPTFRHEIVQANSDPTHLEGLLAHELAG